MAEATGVEVIHLGMRRHPGPYTIGRLAQLFRRRSIGVVHAYLYGASVAARIAGRLSRVPVVITSTRASLGYLPRLAWWLDRVTARWCQRVIAVSKGTAAFLIDQEGMPKEKVVVIPNGVDLDHFRPGNRLAARARLGIPPNAFVIASVGRLHPQKGHEFLLAAIARLCQRLPDVLCLIAGDGADREKLMGLSLQLNVENSCRFLGWVSDMRDVYAAADVTVQTSLYEGMPNVVLEAMAMGCPVVATAVEGSVELVRPDQTGFLVPSADAASLFSQLLYLGLYPERRATLGLLARHVVENEHGVDRMVGAIERLYDAECKRAGVA
jgi:glycosyltransferase involved in cell wall biosynthesis